MERTLHRYGRSVVSQKKELSGGVFFYQGNREERSGREEAEHFSVRVDKEDLLPPGQAFQNFLPAGVLHQFSLAFLHFSHRNRE